MSVTQTKSFKPKGQFPFFGGLFGFLIFSFVLLYGWFSFEGTVNATSDRVTVDGVTNTTQYLTSMILHAPGKTETVELKYDPDLNALRIKGKVNADALIIGDGKSSAGNAILGGKGNISEAGSHNGLIVGGEGNVLRGNSSNSIVIGGNSNTLLNTNNVGVIASSNTTFPAEKGGTKQNVLVIGGDRNKVHGSMIFLLGAGNNTADSQSVLMGKNIDAKGKNKIFVWSPNDSSFKPGKSNAFYVNSKNGIGFNTNDPQVKFDFGNAGALKLANVYLNTNPNGECKPDWKGVMAYVETGGVSGLCGCNGVNWVPLTSDPLSQGVCMGLQKKACAGAMLNAKAITPTVALPRWNVEANGGDGAWQPVTWTYGGIPALSGTAKECGYECTIGFHPGADNPSGWQMGGCKACSNIANKYAWKSAGTGNNNCDFSCKAGFKYTNTKTERSCSSCAVGTWSKDDNQKAACDTCKAPAKLYVDKQGQDPHYSAFTTTGTSDTSCNFDCSPRYAHFYNGKATTSGKISVVNGTIIPAGNACIHCPIGTWSSGGKQKACSACTNLPKAISYKVGSQSFTLTGAYYSSNGDLATTCDWKCNSRLGLKKQESACVCSNDHHLEGGRCVPNKKSVPCDGTGLPENSVSIDSSVDLEWKGTMTSGSWGAVPKCDWKCSSGYTKQNNKCVPSLKCRTSFSKLYYYYPSLNQEGYDYPLTHLDSWGTAFGTSGWSWNNTNYPLTKWERGEDKQFYWKRSDIWASALCEGGDVKDVHSLRGEKGKNHGSILKYVCSNPRQEVDCELSLPTDANAHFESWGNGPSSDDIRFYPVCNPSYTLSSKAGKCVKANPKCNESLPKKLNYGKVKPSDFCGQGSKINRASIRFTRGASHMNVDVSKEESIEQRISKLEKFVTTSVTVPQKTTSVTVPQKTTSVEYLKALKEYVYLNDHISYHCQNSDSRYDDLYVSCTVACNNDIKGAVMTGDIQNGYQCICPEGTRLNAKGECGIDRIDEGRTTYTAYPCPDGDGVCIKNNRGQWVDQKGKVCGNQDKPDSIDNNKASTVLVQGSHMS